MFKKNEIQPFLPEGLYFLHAKRYQKTVNFAFFSQQKEEYLYINCLFVKTNHWIIDFDYYDVSNFEMIEQLSLICHIVKSIIENHSYYRLKILTGMLTCTLSEHVIPDLPAYHQRCSYEYLETYKNEILNFFESIPLSHLPHHHTSPLFKNLYVQGRDGYVLGNFLESLSLLYIYPDKQRGGFILEFNDSIMSPRVYQSERLEHIAQFLISKGYSVSLL